MSIILSLSAGSIATVYVFNYFGLLNNDNNTMSVSKEVVDKKVTIVEDNTLKEAIDKIYDAAYVIEVYDRNNNKIGSGSGFSYKVDESLGYIITNYHVIEDGYSVKVIDSQGNSIDASIVGGDEYSDIAVLSIDSSYIKKIASIGSSTNLSLGDTVFTVGSPLGSKYIGTVTKGIISGINREVTVNLTNGAFIMEVLQTDAAINPGNSGGALLNINGEVIGVTSMKLVLDEIEGMGFAIPIELVMSTVEKLEKGEKIERPFIGINIVDVSKAYALKRYGINTYDLTSGVVVVNVYDNTPAATTLKSGDIITKIDDDEITDSAHFNYTLYKYNVGDTIKITYYRNGEKNTVDVVLSKKL